MQELEQISFEIISSTGEAKSKIMLSLEAAEMGDFNQAEILQTEAKHKLTEAHNKHFLVITNEANGCKQDINLLFIHAEDQLMTTELLKDLSIRFIQLYKKLEEV